MHLDPGRSQRILDLGARIGRVGMFQLRSAHYHTRLIDLMPDYPFPQTCAL